MPHDAKKLMENGAIRLISRGNFWPIEVIAMDAFEARVRVADIVALREDDHVAIKVGDLPSSPALVLSENDHVVDIQFLSALHPRILELASPEAATQKSKRSRLSELKEFLEG